MHQYTIQQALLTRNGVDELLLAKRTYPDESHFYALAHLIDAAQAQLHRRASVGEPRGEIRAGRMTLRDAFVRGETAFWYRCTRTAEGLQSGEHETTDLSEDLSPAPITLTEASRSVPAPRIKAPAASSIPRATTIDPAVLTVLSQATCEGNLLRLNGQLDRKLYEAVNKVLDEAGGKWKSGKLKAHVFEGDAAETIESVLLTGQIATKQDFGFYQTSSAIVSGFVLPRLSLTPDSLVLEPSAGRGAIARELAKICRVECIELQERNVNILKAEGYARRVVQADFLSLDPKDFPKYDAVVMNPPFANRADIKHCLHASRFVKAGGQLVAIMGANVTYRADKLTQQFKTFVEYNGGSIAHLPEGAFKESGTMFPTVIASMRMRHPELAYAAGSDFSR